MELNRKYEIAIRKAKYTSWKNYCNLTESSNPWNAGYKVAASRIKQKLTMTTLRKSDGTFTKNLKETMELMMESFCPIDDESNVRRFTFP